MTEVLIANDDDKIMMMVIAVTLSGTQYYRMFEARSNEGHHR